MIQVYWFNGYWVTLIQVEEEEEDDDENMDKMCKPILCTYYITTQPIFVYWIFSHFLHLDIIPPVDETLPNFYAAAPQGLVLERA